MDRIDDLNNNLTRFKTKNLVKLLQIFSEMKSKSTIFHIFLLPYCPGLLYFISLCTHTGHLHPPTGQSYFQTYTAEVLSALNQETAGETSGRTATGRISEADTKLERCGLDPRSFPKSTSQSAL